MPIQLASFGATRQGLRRSENQDAFFAAPELGLFVVVDAMGSARAAALTLAAFEETLASAPREGTLDGVLTAAARRANADILEAERADASLRGMGATFVALLVGERRARVAWIGECRCYRARDGKTALLTEDDGALGCCFPGAVHDADELPLSPVRHVLGGDPNLDVHEQELSPLSAGDIYLLSSDGLHGLYEDNVHLVLDLAGDQPLPRAVSLLMEQAVHEFDDDDATALCVRVCSP